MDIKYNLENLKDLPLKIENVNKEFPNIFVNIENLPIIFKNYQDYEFFSYYLKRQLDLKTFPQKKTSVTFDELLEYPVLNSQMNILANFEYDDINMSTYKMFEREFKEKSDKCFWGTLLDDKKVNIVITDDKSIEVDYVTDKTEENSTRVLVQPEGYEYDQSFWVYTSSVLKPNKFTDIAYFFRKTQENLIFEKALLDDWVY